MKKKLIRYPFERRRYASSTNGDERFHEYVPYYGFTYIESALRTVRRDGGYILIDRALGNRTNSQRRPVCQLLLLQQKNVRRGYFVKTSSEKGEIYVPKASSAT